MIGERIVRGLSNRRLSELVTYWSGEEAGAQTESERQLCRRMLDRYRGEKERRERNGRDGKGD